METILLQINNEKAYKLIEDLEALDIVKVLKKENDYDKVRLSEKFSGALKLTDKEYSDFQNYATEIRKEWERDI